MDRQTDGQTELRQQYRVLHYMQSHGRKGSKTHHTAGKRRKVHVVGIIQTEFVIEKKHGSAIECLERLTSKMTCYVLSGTLNFTYWLTQSEGSTSSSQFG